MKKMQKVIIALTAILMMLAVPLTAAEMSVRWSWALDDPDVTAYRYQMGGENPEGWTELSGDVSSLELSGLDASAEYTLYLQRSYDGKNWSPSAVSTAKADLDAVPDVRIYCYADYELRAEIYTGSVILSYPKAVSDADAIAFIATENEKYGLSELGVRYELNGDGSATFSYPVTISRETVIAELDRLVADLIEYITTPVEEPVPVVVPVPAAVEEPLVKEYSYAGYTLTATIDTGSTLLVYPAFVTDDEVNGFFAYENEKYDLASLGVFYAFGEAGEVTVSYPEIYSKETVAVELDRLVADLIEYLTTPVEEPVPVVVPVPAAVEEPLVKEYSYAGYTLTATIDTGSTLLVYPAFVTDDEVNGFFAHENEKYDLASLGVFYAFGEAGEVTVSYPEIYSKETVAVELDRLVADLIEYLTTPVEEPVPVVVPVSVPLVKEYSYAGYTLTAAIDTGSTLLVYPAFVTDDEVNGFFAYVNEKYDLASLGVFYAFGEAGEVTVSYPEIYSKETVAAELDKLVADLIAYITPAAVPVTEPEVPAVIPLTPIAPAEVVEDESLFAFSLLVRGGVLSSFDDTFTFDGRIFADLGLGFDFSHLISAGENFGIGLRSDLDLNFLPKETGKWNLENPLDYFNVFVYGEMVSLDLKVMMEFTAGPADIYIGGGAGFAIGNPFDNPAIEDYLALGTFDIGKVRFSMDWFASATAGVRFYTSDLFSIGAEVNYRYMVESQKHMGSAGIILGFTF